MREIKNMLNFPQVDSETTVWFIFDNKEYELSQFSISFGQGIDHKGQPQDEVRGGRMVLVLSEAVPENIYQWAMTSSMKNGEIVFRSKTTSPPLRVTFTDGCCVTFERAISNNMGLTTTLIVSPYELSINGISFDNHWVK